MSRDVRLNEFIEHDNVDYTRSASVLGAAQASFKSTYYSIGPKLFIVGCGGIGFWAGIYAAMLGFFDAVYLFDGDKIDSTNLARLPVPGSWVGVNKAVALKRVIHTLRPALPVIPIMKPANTVLLNAIITPTSNVAIYILDCTDDARAQNEVFNWSKGFKEKVYAKAGYEGMEFGVYTEINTWVPADYQPGYTTAASNVLTSAAAAAYAVTSLIFRGNTTEAKFSMLDKICTTQRQQTLTKAMKAVQEGQPVTRI